MPIKDALLTLQVLVTKTADFDGASIDLKTSMPLSGLGVQVITTTAPDQVTGDETYLFVLEESPDDSVWNALYTWPIEDSSAATLVAQEVFAKVSSRKRYVRLRLDVEGTTPSITYKAFLTFDVPT